MVHQALDVENAYNMKNLLVDNEDVAIRVSYQQILPAERTT